jgi:hypothetical protein
VFRRYQPGLPCKFIGKAIGSGSILFFSGNTGNIRMGNFIDNDVEAGIANTANMQTCDLTFP